MLPQSITGRPKVYGKSEKEKKQIFKDISILKKVGVFYLVVECTLKKVLDELIKFSDIKSNKITVSGVPHFDIYFDNTIDDVEITKKKFNTLTESSTPHQLNFFLDLLIKEHKNLLNQNFYEG